MLKGGKSLKVIGIWELAFDNVHLVYIYNIQSLRIQSPSENGFMEPKYLSEKVIGDPLLII